MRTLILISTLLRSGSVFTNRISWPHLLSVPMDTGFISWSTQGSDLWCKCPPASPGNSAMKGSSLAPLLVKEHLAQLTLKESYEDKQMFLCAGKVEAYRIVRAGCMNCWTAALSSEPAKSTLLGRSIGLWQAWSFLVCLPAFSCLWWRDHLCQEWRFILNNPLLISPIDFWTYVNKKLAT